MIERRGSFVLLLMAVCVVSSVVEGADHSAFRTLILPPIGTWDGASRARVVPATDPWITPAEKSGFARTPDYDETVAWLKRLEKASSNIRMVSIGRSDQGRDVWMVIASRDRAFNPEAMRRSGKPLILVQAGIHSGEIDGKDAGMMLLRDMTVRGTRKELLDQASLLFIPIFNVDGHERSSAFSRPNQRGPENQGWRTNARNLNLNRDYTKADTPEMRGLLRTLQLWQPDLYIDVHVTDGADYQYDITYGFNPDFSWSPSISRWLTGFGKLVDERLSAEGHIPGPLIQGVGGNDLTQGIYGWAAGPRFSHGYGDAVHIPSILVENHSLKPYEQRVLGTCVLIESAINIVSRQKESLRAAIRSDRDARRDEIPIAFDQPKAPVPEMIDLLGIEAKQVPSAISGSVRTEFTGKPVMMKVPQIWTTSSVITKRPLAYWIPPSYGDVVDRLALHGIRMERMPAARTIEVEMYRLSNARFEVSAFATNPFEGHARINADEKIELRRETFPAGSVRVSTDQPLGDLVMLLLEPQSPDSFFQWGFFTEIQQQTEYIEEYVIEPMAEKMLAADPELAREFAEKLTSDAVFRGDANARLAWFYAKTPYQDDRWLLYPVAREK